MASLEMLNLACSMTDPIHGLRCKDKHQIKGLELQRWLEARYSPKRARSFISSLVKQKILILGSNSLLRRRIFSPKASYVWSAKFASLLEHSTAEVKCKSTNEPAVYANVSKDGHLLGNRAISPKVAASLHARKLALKVLDDAPSVRAAWSPRAEQGLVGSQCIYESAALAMPNIATQGSYKFSPKS
eukprot:TRINITY_DN9784_c0_g1_i10.p4 TRINITY_DN9784_c0_g1~~TRINITY_DN9784_c0_g1_i10.p4  ORF type:complete len:187 (+),score=17.03 TRINITY_DN9784_c0_g1_i10:3512-4072(+)